MKRLCSRGSRCVAQRVKIGTKSLEEASISAETFPSRCSIIVGLIQDHEIIVSSHIPVATLGRGRRSRNRLFMRILKGIGMGRTQGWAGGDIDNGQV